MMTAALGAAFALFAPLVTSAASPPALLRFTAPAPGMNSYVYWYDPNGNRYVFLSNAAVTSWYPDASSRVEETPVAELAKIPLKGTMSHKPAARLLKFASSPRIYAVSRYGMLRWLTTENVAVALYGPNWKSSMDEISVADYPVYRFASPVTDEAEFAKGDLFADIATPSQNIPSARPPEKFAATASLTADKTSALVGQTVTLTVSVSNQGTAWNNVTIRLYDGANQVIKTCRGAIACEHGLNVTGPLGRQTYTARAFNEFEQSVESAPVTVNVANPS